MLEKIFRMNGQSVLPEKTPSTDVNTEKLLFPSELFAKLPTLLKEGCDLLEDENEKNIFLLGALGVLSGCFPKYYGIYDNKRVGCNLYVFITAPASAGKSSLIWARYLGKAIHESLKENSISQEESEVQAMPKHLFISANSSSSAFLYVLENNENRGVLFCTEADTLSNTLSQDWGNYDDILRCCFQHEQISQLRKKDKEFIEIERPYLSVVLSGTPAQVKRLIPDVENGLFSRFCFFELDINPTMRDVFATSEISFEDAFEALGKRIFKVYDRLRDWDSDVYFSYTTPQQKKFLEYFSKTTHSFFYELGEFSISTVRRLGLIQFRIAMILTMLRHEKEPILPEKLKCSDLDYDLSAAIAQTLLSHAKNVFLKLSEGRYTNG